MSICQLGMHKNVQDHTNANVCKQTYDASCSSTIEAAHNTSKCARPVGSLTRSADVAETGLFTVPGPLACRMRLSAIAQDNMTHTKTLRRIILSHAPTLQSAAGTYQAMSTLVSA